MFMLLQADDVHFLDRAPMVLMGAALKEAALPPGTLAHLAERFLPTFLVTVLTQGHRERQASYLLVRRAQAPAVCPVLLRHCEGGGDRWPLCA
jgi:hypothetical protein